MSEKIIVEYGSDAKDLLTGQDKIIAGNKAISKGADTAAAAQKRLTTQIRDVKDQLGKLALAGKEGTKEFEDLTAQSGRLQKAITTVNKELAITGSRTNSLTALTKVATGAAAAFELAQGASALFGGEQKNIEKQILKVQAAMAILNGVQEISLLLQEKNTILTNLFGKESKAAAVGQAVYATAVGSSTGALKLFRLALLGTGLGAIALVLLAVATNFDKVKEVISKVIPESVQKAFTFLKDSLVGIYDGVKNFIGLGDAVKANSTIYTAFGGSLAKIQQPLKDIPGKLKEMKDKAKEQEAALKKLTDSGAPGSVGRYTFLLNEAKSALDKLVPGTDAYNNQLKVTTDLQDKLNDAINKTVDGRQKLFEAQQKERDDLKKTFKDTANIREDDAKKVSEQREKDAEDKKKAKDEERELLLKESKEQDEKNEQDAKDEKEKKKQQIQDTIDLAQSAANIIAGINQIAFNVEKSNLDKQLKNKKISQEKYDKELKEIQIKAAKRDKALNIFQAIINTAAAVAKALPNVALSIAAGIAGAVQIAVIASQPIPQFAKGVINLKGKGTGTSDSIMAMLSRGESVMTADETAKYKSHLTAIREGNYEQMIYRNHILPAVMKVKIEMQNSLANLMVKATLDDSRIVKALTNQKQPKDINYNRLASLINQGNSNRRW